MVNRVALFVVLGLWHQGLALYGHRPSPAVSAWTHAGVYRPNRNEQYFPRFHGYKSRVDRTFPSPPTYRNYGSDSFILVGTDSGAHPLFTNADTTAFQTASYQYFLRLLCPREVKNAEEVRFNSRRFVADIDNDYNFALQLREGNSFSDNAILKLPDWLRAVTCRYEQSLRAAFTMFDLMDVDRSGFISRHDFVHWLVDTNRDGIVTVCEEMDHVNKVARLAEHYIDVLQKQERVLWNYLYDPNFPSSPFSVGSRVRPTARTVDQKDGVTGQQTPAPERNETAEMTEAMDTLGLEHVPQPLQCRRQSTTTTISNTTSATIGMTRMGENGMGAENSTSLPRKKNAPSANTTQGQTSQQLPSEGNRSHGQRRQNPDQEITSQSVTSASTITSASTTASWITAEATTTDFDLIVRGLFKIEG